LISHNPLYNEYSIDLEIIASLPEDDVLIEILAGARQETDISLLVQESETYLPNEESGGESHRLLSRQVRTDGRY